MSLVSASKLDDSHLYFQYPEKRIEGEKRSLKYIDFDLNGLSHDIIPIF